MPELVRLVKFSLIAIQCARPFAVPAAAPSARAAPPRTIFAPVNNPTTELLWPNGAPGALGTDDADKPALTIYLPSKPQDTGTGIVVCPGGGYQHLAMDHEGHQVARWLTSRGIAAFIVKYRLGPTYHHPAMLQDVLRAIRVVRSRATEFRVRPRSDRRDGLLRRRPPGLVGGDAVRSPGRASGRRPRERELASGLRSPRLSRSSRWARPSQQGLAGEPARRAPLAGDCWTRLSTDKQVTAKTPPTFLFHTDADAGVPAGKQRRCSISR